MNCRILIILCPFLFFGCEFKTEKAESNDSLKSEADALSRAAIQGKNFLEDGSTYEGELVRGLPHGFGIKEFSNQDLYEGQFQNGKAHGHGTLRYKSDVNLEKYVGAWSNGRRRLWNSRFYGFLQNGWALGHGFLALWGFSKYRMEPIISGKWNRDSLSEGKMRDEFGNQFSGFFNQDGSYRQDT